MVFGPKKYGRGQPMQVGELRERPVGRAVEIAPQQRRDHRRHRVGDEEADAEEALGIDHAAVEDQREEQRQDQHHRDLHRAELEQREHAGPELRVDEGLGEVVEPDEAGAADQRRLVDAEIERVDQRDDQEGDEDQQEGQQEQVGRDALADR